MVACRHSGADDVATAFATLDGGAFVQRGEADEPVEAAPGDACGHANVLHLPNGWCEQLEALLIHLEDTGLGMPVELTRTAPEQSSSVDGLLDLVLGTADLAVAPPRRYLAQVHPPPHVLCAFELLLTECGCSLTDVYGRSLGLADACGAPIYAEADATIGQGGLLACAECMQPYFVRALASAFPITSELERFADRDEFYGRAAPSQRPIRLLDEDGKELSI